MTRIAHLSDVHLNGSKNRRDRFLQALDRAQHFGATHLVLTGDLTASGARDQFVELAGCLERWPSDRVAMTPGNHDGSVKDWAKAMAGPLRRFTHLSRVGVADLGDVIIAVASTQIDQPWPMACGKVNGAQLHLLRACVEFSRARLVVVAMHHPPIESPLDRFDGLINRDEVAAIIANGPNLHVLCGHDHRVLDSGRVHIAGSVAHHPDPLRLYDVIGGSLVLRYRSANEGSYMQLVDDIFPPPHQV